MGASRKRDKRVKARTATKRAGARAAGRHGPAKGIPEGEGRTPFVEHLLRSFKETDLPHAIRRAMGVGARATRQVTEAVRKKWVDDGLDAPAEALRTRELADIDEMLRVLLFHQDGRQKGRVRDAALVDMPSVVKLLQLRDRVTERLLKNEERIRRRPSGFLGHEVDLSGAAELRGVDDAEFDEVEKEGNEDGEQ